MAISFKYFSLLVILGTVFLSVIIGLIFLLINKWISRRAGKHSIGHLDKRFDFKVESNKYQERNLEACTTPPLPPRTQFLTAEAQSYENLAETPNHEQSIHDDEQSIHDYEEGIHDYEQSIHDYEEGTEQQPDYLKLDDEAETFPSPPAFNDPGANMKSGVGESYENLAEEHDYEQSTDDQPDYVEVEGEEEAILPHPAHPDADSISTEDYDDIEAENQDEEDYDDVG